MKRIRPPQQKPRRPWLHYAGIAGGLLFVSGFLEAVFAQSAVLLTVFLAYLLVISLLGHVLGLWN